MRHANRDQSGGASLEDFKRQLNVRAVHPDLEVESYDTRFQREMVKLKPKNYPFIDALALKDSTGALPNIKKARPVKSRTLPLMTQEIKTAELHLKSPFLPNLLNRNAKDMPFGLTNQATIDQGIREYQKGDNASAVSRFTNALKVDGKNQFALFFRGMALERLRQYRRAMNDFSTFISMYPSKPIPYYNRGICHLHLGEDVEAIKDLTSAMDFEPSLDAQTDYYSARGLAHRRLEHFVESQKDYMYLKQLNERRLGKATATGKTAKVKIAADNSPAQFGSSEPSAKDLFQDAMKTKAASRTKEQMQILLERSSRIKALKELSTPVLQQLWCKIEYKVVQETPTTSLMTEDNASTQLLGSDCWFVLVRGTCLIKRKQVVSKEASEGGEEEGGQEEEAQDEADGEKPADDAVSPSSSMSVGSLSQGEAFDFATISAVVARSKAAPESSAPVELSTWALKAASKGMPIELLVLEKDSYESIFRAMIDEANADKVRMLVRLGIFAPPTFTKQTVQELMQLSVTASFEAGQTITEQGELADAFYMLLKGSVKVTKTVQEPGAPQPCNVGVTLLTPGDILGEAAILEYKKLGRYPSNAICNTAVKVMKFMRRDLQRYCDEQTRERVRKQAVRYMSDSKFIQAIRDHRKWSQRKDNVIDRMITVDREICLNKGSKYVPHSDYVSGVKAAQAAARGRRRASAHLL
jgi:tetratricopeptide (TPR) repeat protein